MATNMHSVIFLSRKLNAKPHNTHTHTHRVIKPPSASHVFGSVCFPVMVRVPVFLVTKQGSRLRVLPFPTLLLPCPETRGEPQRGKGEEGGRRGGGAFHRHAKTFRGKPSQIFPTVCGVGFASPVTHTHIQFEKVLEMNSHWETFLFTHSTDHLHSPSLWYSHIYTVSGCSREWHTFFWVTCCLSSWLSVWGRETLWMNEVRHDNKYSKAFT